MFSEHNFIIVYALGNKRGGKLRLVSRTASREMKRTKQQVVGTNARMNDAAHSRLRVVDMMHHWTDIWSGCLRYLRKPETNRWPAVQPRDRRWSKVTSWSAILCPSFASSQFARSLYTQQNTIVLSFDRMIVPLLRQINLFCFKLLKLSFANLTCFAHDTSILIHLCFSEYKIRWREETSRSPVAARKFDIPVTITIRKQHPRLSIEHLLMRSFVLI